MRSPVGWNQNGSSVVSATYAQTSNVNSPWGPFVVQIWSHYGQIATHRNPRTQPCRFYRFSCLKFYGNEVYYTAWFLVVIVKPSCSKLDCQKVWGWYSFSIRSFSSASRRCGLYLSNKWLQCFDGCNHQPSGSDQIQVWNLRHFSSSRGEFASASQEIGNQKSLFWSNPEGGSNVRGR